MPAGVADADALGTGLDRSRVQGADGVRMGTSGVLRHEHRRQVVLGAELDRLARELQHVVEVPVLRELADGTRTDEGADLDRLARLLHDVDDRLGAISKCSGGYLFAPRTLSSALKLNELGN